MIPAIIDVEASGFGAGSYPIEVGVVLSDRTTHCYLIQPEAEWTHWSAEAESLHGISRELLMEKGQPAREVGECLNRILLGQTVYSDAWNYDFSWVGKLYDAAELLQGFRIDSLRSILTHPQLEAWDNTRELVEAELSLRRHRASSDAMIIQTVFDRTSASGSELPTIKASENVRRPSY
ncbi:MAG: hypothetical protein JKY01_06055 [Pseudomonadales bacterium]|nr:hypothetical protein [Pseudomonadales bacterium]